MKWATAIINLSERKARNILGLFTGHYDLRCYTHKTQGTSVDGVRKKKRPQVTSFVSHCQKCMSTGILDPEFLKEVDLLTFCRAVGMVYTS